MPVISGVRVDLTPGEVSRVRAMLGREPNATEIGMIDVMWSEHCSYKSSRPVLKVLPTEGERVLIGPGFDAGVVDIGGGYAVVFKIESHNHPSAIDPYNGAATGIGGIIRDILSMGARPVALLDALRFGSIEGGHSRWLMKHVVGGISDYGNCVGIPTVAGEIEFDESFETNCLVNVVCVGIVKHGGVMRGEMRKPGDLVVLTGGSTGKDGIHGVTFASKTLDEKSEEDRPSVQVGDPFLKKLVIEATLEALQTGFVHGLKDCGGGGITCATSEMAAAGGAGVEVWLERIPLRETGMGPFEIMLSESQERMILVVDPKGLDKVAQILDKYELPHSVIGKVTSTGEVVVKSQGQVVARLPARGLAKAPVIIRRAKRWRSTEPEDGAPPTPSNPSQTVLSLLSSPNIADKAWVYRQYDHEVGVRTVIKPGDADAAVLRLLELEGKGIAVKSDGNSRHGYLDPCKGAAGAVAEAASNVSAVGAKPLAMVDELNWGDPRKPEVFWQFKQAVLGMANMCAGLGIPCVGGKVSFYNEDESTGRSVKPSTVVVVVGLIEDMGKVTTLPFKCPGDAVIVLGRTHREMGGSEYYYHCHSLSGGKPPAADPSRTRSSIESVLEAIEGGFVTAAHDCSRGGLGIGLAQMSIKSGLGLRADLDLIPKQPMRIDELLFSESYSRFILACDESKVQDVLRICRRQSTPAKRVGTVVDSERFVLVQDSKPVVDCSVQEMREAWSEAIPRMMGVAS